MRPTLLLPFAVFIGSCIILSCGSDKINTQLLNDLNEGLEANNRRIAFSNDIVLQTLQMKAENIRTAEKAAIWLPRAKKAREFSSHLIAFIDSVQGLLTDTTEKSLSTDDIFISKGIGEELRHRLGAYKSQLFSAIPNFENQEGKTINGFLFSGNGFISGEQYLQENFMNLDKHEAISALTLLQNKVLITENVSLSFCNEQFTFHDNYFDTFEALVSQDTRILEGGDELEITAALGTISRSKIPKFTMNNRPIPLNERGIVVHKIKAPIIPGNYTVPVKISYIDQDGKEQTHSFNVEYRVVKRLE